MGRLPHAAAVALGPSSEVSRAETPPGGRRRGDDVASKAVISLTTGLEDPEKVTVAFLMAVGAAEQGRPTVMFCAKEAVRLAQQGVAQGVACEGCPPLPDLAKRYEAAGGRYLVCPICFNAKNLDDSTLVTNAALGGTVPLWEWIGDEPATTFSY
jgi:predicted peroxiredoxin